MTSQLLFRVLTTPLSDKSLQEFRKDAGWHGHSTQHKNNAAQPSKGRVQWVSVEVGKARVGIARLELAPPEFCYVADLIVASKHRNRGVGRWLLRHIEQHCTALGIVRLILQAAPGTESFYESQQFVSDPYVPALLKKDINPFQRRLFAPAP